VYCEDGTEIMAKKETFISDLTGKPVVYPVKIQVSREGHYIKIGNDTYVGDTVLEVDASELPDIMSKLTFIKNAPVPSQLLRTSPDLATATFFGAVGQSSIEPEKVPVARSGTALDSLPARG
jgi:hypothetical protein